MTSSGGNTLKNGYIGRTGRQEPNKLRKELERLKEENFISLYEMHNQIAHTHPDIDKRMSAQQFLLNKVMPNALPGRYVKLELIAITSIDDIKTNEKIIMESIGRGHTSLEEGEKLYAMTEQARKTYEATEVIKLIEDIDVRLKENGM